MAWPAGVVLECRPGSGADTNGGGFVTGASGTDWSQQDSAQYAVTDAVAIGTTTITSVTANFGTDVVGNIAYFQGGTGSIAAVGRQIVSRTDATTIVLDAAIAASTGMTCNIGGAVNTIGWVGKLLNSHGVASNRAYIKAGTDAISSTTANVSGGVLSLPSTVAMTIEGYQTTRGDLGTAPVYQAGQVGTYTLITLAGNNTGMQYLVNVDGLCTAGTASGVNLTNYAVAHSCTMTDFNGGASTYGFQCSTGSGSVSECVADGCTYGFSNCDAVSKCEAIECSVGYRQASRNWAIWGSVARGCTSHGFNCTVNDTARISNCTADENAGDGFLLAGSGGMVYASLGTNNTGQAFDVAGTRTCLLSRCADYNNAARSTNTPLDYNAISCSGDPYVSQATNDLRPNNTASAGALLRATGGGPPSQTNSTDVGAVQHTDPTPPVGHAIVVRAPLAV